MCLLNDQLTCAMRICFSFNILKVLCSNVFSLLFLRHSVCLLAYIPLLMYSNLVCVIIGHVTLKGRTNIINILFTQILLDALDGHELVLMLKTKVIIVVVVRFVLKVVRECIVILNGDNAF